jgi:hypothetical protein
MNVEPRDDARQKQQIQSQKIKKAKLLQVDHWRSIFDVTLTIKQGRRADNGTWICIDEFQCQLAFWHFKDFLNRAVYGNAVRRYGKTLRIIPVLEKSTGGRWHYHVAIEPPTHLDAVEFEALIHNCWAETDWGYREVMVRDDADSGWIRYMLKPSQKSCFDGWADCIDWFSLNNPVVDA